MLSGPSKRPAAAVDARTQEAVEGLAVVYDSGNAVRLASHRAPTPVARAAADGCDGSKILQFFIWHAATTPHAALSI